MSAICGLMHMDFKAETYDTGIAMLEKFNIYKVDSVRHLMIDNVFMGCGIQYITRESKYETLPAYDQKRELIITADAIIDNRSELLKVFNIKLDSWSKTTDSELILRAYEMWGKDCAKYLIGDFAFVIWDKVKNEIFCARDHVGKRTLYYYYDGNTFAFSTLMNPLFEVQQDVELNDRWIADFLSIDGILHEVECNETIYKGIYQVPPATIITINKNGLCKDLYWDPLKEVKPLRLKKDEEYDKYFKKVFFEAVDCRLRSSGEVGIMLSGGLDSGSVGCIAARNLENEGKRLKAFCSIPMDSYKNINNQYYMSDESEYVEEIIKAYNNIDITYCKSEGKNSSTNIDRFVSILEQPYKTIENLFWNDEILQRASKSGCKVLLSGQYGNCTISFGDFVTNALTLFRDMRYIRLYKEIRAYSRLKKIRRYKIGKALIKVFTPYNIRKLLSSKNEGYDNYADVPANRELIKKWNVDKRLSELKLNEYPQRYYDLYETRKSIVNPIAFSHIGAMETKLSLSHGIIERDPTRDKRVIEFCLSLPTEQFYNDGQDRNLIRRGMKGILPDKIRLNRTRRGLQSADWIERLNDSWKSIKEQLDEYLQLPEIKNYIDVEKVKLKLSTIDSLSGDEKWFSIRLILEALVFSYFLLGFKEEKAKEIIRRETAATK
ncbi:asparagine synthetase B [Clostridium polyendosporum]|uniref:asparagine synthase (glutamine-hydrolyzing) n=1 Tax=Clostridium polyendosporum TaxID=69208 RepID=A0A919VEG0_9CLOT|nr:asparagine synthase-related protein [Clostridium polyendosporum]GIM27390.1 asparagine synthetase B [Clostridium polyendosporum]